MTTDTQALIERLTPCTEDDLMKWLEARLLIDLREYENAVHEAKTFSERTDWDWSPFANQWGKYADHFAEVVGRWLAIKAIIADRNEWKEQHENLLSVRQSDLTTLTTALTTALTDADTRPPTDEAIATLQARGDRLANAIEALNNSFEKHRPKALWDEARAAITEWRKGC
jgi:hypothetical protein